MFSIKYISVFIGLVCLFFTYSSSDGVVYGSENNNNNGTFTTEPTLDLLVNLTGNNDLWTILLKDCQNKPSLKCVQDNIFNYLRKTLLNDTNDLQFTSYMKFSKNNINYEPIRKSLDLNDTDDDGDDDDEKGNDEYWQTDEYPIEAMSRNLQENTAEFLMTHDLELSLPDGLLPNSVLKIAPKGFGDTGALVNLEIISKDLQEAAGMEQQNGRTFKKIRKFVNEKIIYAVLALLLVLKLLAFKFLFLLPLMVGAATAKKLLLKILLFVFPFLHHIFKFCAFYPIQAKYHHHKHLISHIHKIAPHHQNHYHDDHPEGIEVIDPHGHHDTHFQEFDDDVSVVNDDGSGFPHGVVVPILSSFLNLKYVSLNAVKLAVHGIKKIINFFIINPQWFFKLNHFLMKMVKSAFHLLKKIVGFLIINPWVIEKTKDFLKKSLHWSVFFIPQVVKMISRNLSIRHFGEKIFGKSLNYFAIALPIIITKLSSALNLIGHRRDPIHQKDNEISPYSVHQVHQPYRRNKPDRPSTSSEIERMIAKAEKEAIIKARLEKERLRIRDENLKLQEQLNYELKHQEKLKLAAHFGKKSIPSNNNNKILPQFNNNNPYYSSNKFDNNVHPSPPLKGSHFDASGLELPAGYIPQHTVTHKPQIIVEANNNNNYYSGKYDQVYQSSENLNNWKIVNPNNNNNNGPVYNTEKSSIINKESQVNIQKSVEYDPRIVGSFETTSNKEIDPFINNYNQTIIKKVTISTTTPSASKSKLELDIYKAAHYDPFYSPILEKIDKILQELGFKEEPCKERLICSMYKNPTVFSPHSNLLSAELSRDSSELQKPTTTNSAVVRFYKYVQAARDGQDQRDCLRLYAACSINTEIS